MATGKPITLEEIAQCWYDITFGFQIKKTEEARAGAYLNGLGHMGCKEAYAKGFADGKNERPDWWASRYEDGRKSGFAEAREKAAKIVVGLAIMSHKFGGINEKVKGEIEGLADLVLSLTPDGDTK